MSVVVLISQYVAVTDNSNTIGTIIYDHKQKLKYCCILIKIAVLLLNIDL